MSYCVRATCDAYHRQHALAAHARVDPAALVVGVHKHDVPNLQPIIVGGLRICLEVSMNEEIDGVEDLGTISARRVLRTHAPEVVRIASIHNLSVRKAANLFVNARSSSHLLPQLSRCVVLLVNGNAKELVGNAELLVDELVRHGNRLLLVVVAEREVSKHLKHGLMTRRESNLSLTPSNAWKRYPDRCAFLPREYRAVMSSHVVVPYANTRYEMHTERALPSNTF